MRILGSPNRRLRLDGPRTLAAVKETRSRKGRPAAGGGDALPSNSGRERRTRLPSVLLEATCGKISQERLDWTGFIEGHEVQKSFARLGELGGQKILVYVCGPAAALQ